MFDILKYVTDMTEKYDSERRLAFRSNLPSTEAGTIPPEFDELSDREVEYYKTGPWGMGKKEVIIDPSITIGKGEVGANIPLKTASKAEKGKMVALGKENIKTQIKLLKEYLSPESRLKSRKVVVASTLNKFLTSKGVDICG